MGRGYRRDVLRADVKKAAEYYGARGAKVMPGVHDGDNCLMAFVEDTEGNHFILHQRKTG